MGRPKKYSPEEATDRALAAFWAKGYEATSLSDLEQATGLNKFSLYASFGSKRGLYGACLVRYVERYLLPAFRGFHPASDQDVEAFLGLVVDNLGKTGSLGCFLLNSGQEFQGKDPEVDRLVSETYGLLTETARAYWNDANRAEAFTTLVRGLMASARVGLDPSRLHRAVEGSRALWASGE